MWTSAALARQAIAGQIAQRIRTTGPLRFRKGSQRLLAIAGPTGVGKTTTVAKIAASQITRGRKVSLVNLDTYKTGATQQLGSYAELLGVPFYVAYSPLDLGKILGNLTDSDLVLLDMPGCGARNRPLIAESREFLRQVPHCKVHLAISCTMHYGAMLEVATAFGDLPIDAMVLTKIDEATHLGPALSFVHKLGKPVSYLTTGQSVPADLEIATAQRLAELVVADEVAA
jgi:flagellar biosynthesis protein FlhF